MAYIITNCGILNKAANVQMILIGLVATQTDFFLFFPQKPS